jgi:hypothetical protein
MKNLILCFTVLISVRCSIAQEKKSLELEIYGQIMTDAGYNVNRVNPQYFDAMRPTQLPANKDQYGTDGNLFFSVRQSMLGFKSFLPTPQGDLRAKFAFDLYGVGPNVGQTTFHVLYAWVEWWKIGIGYTWSQFCDFDGFPDIVEYWGPVGMSLCKNVIVSFVPLQGANRLSIALERPGASADQGIYRDRIELADVEPKFNLPDLSAEFRMTRKWGYVELAGIVRKIQWVDLGNEPYDLSGHAIGWGFNLSSNLKLGSRSVFKGQVITGEAIQNVMNDAPTDIGIRKTPWDTIAPVKGVALPLVSFSAYLNHSWSKAFTSSAGYSAIFTGNSDGQTDDAFRQGHYASANLLYHPLANLMAGVEVQYICRKNYNDGWRSHDTRIQFSFRYNFSKTFFKNG